MAMGIVWAFAAAVFLGVFALPTKYTKDSAWENTWGAFFFIGMFVVPIIVALAAVKGLGGTYAAVSPGVIAAVIALGFMWGCGNICWGKGIATIGMALGFSIMIGTVTLSGSLLPLFMSSADKAFTLPGLTIIGGLFVCILGIAANGRAGLLREKAQTEGEETQDLPMLKGILICLAGGLLASGCNLAFHVGNNVGGISKISEEQFNNPPYLAGLSVWMLVFIGAGISTCGYCAFLLSTNLKFIGIDSPGAMQSSWTVPAYTLHKLPDNVSLLDGAQVEPDQQDLARAVAARTGDAMADVVFEVSGSTAGVEAMTELPNVRGRIVMVAIHPQPKPVID